MRDHPRNNWNQEGYMLVPAFFRLLPRSSWDHSNQHWSLAATCVVYLSCVQTANTHAVWKCFLTTCLGFGCSKALLTNSWHPKLPPRPSLLITVAWDPWFTHGQDESLCLYFISQFVFQFVSEQPRKTNTILGTDASPNGETHCRLLEEISERCMVLSPPKSTTED